MRADGEGLTLHIELETRKQEQSGALFVCRQLPAGRTRNRLALIEKGLESHGLLHVRKANHHVAPGAIGELRQSTRKEGIARDTEASRIKQSQMP